MEKHGFAVTKNYHLETAWLATFSHGKGGRTIGINSEVGCFFLGMAPCNFFIIDGCFARNRARLRTQLDRYIWCVDCVSLRPNKHLIYVTIFSGVGVAIAIKEALKKFNISAKIALLGTPGLYRICFTNTSRSEQRTAEEGGSGKIMLLKDGAYKDMDACLM